MVYYFTMCSAVEYLSDGSIRTVAFADADAQLPVITREHATRLVTWGRRHYESGGLPVGGSATLESIEGDEWEQWNPVPVKIHVRRYMEKDSRKKRYWFEVPPLHVIQGMIACNDEEQRVYIVTVPSVGDQARICERWPRIMQARPLFREA